MHKYLRAVGFSCFERKSQIDDFFKENLRDENLISTYMSGDMRLCGQHNIEVCSGAGISVIAEQDKGKVAAIDYYYPYLKGYDYTLIQECTIERHSDKESYAGIIDDYRIGIALIFYLSNANVYNSLIKKYKFTDIKIDRIFLSALSIEGRVLLPVSNKSKKENEFADKFKVDERYADYDEDEYDDDEDEDVDLNDLNGSFSDFNVKPLNEKLIDGLNGFSEGFGNKEINIGIGFKIPNNIAGQQQLRLKNEDLYSIVETSLVPHGIECDKYQIVAEILSVNKKVNLFTGEELYEMRLSTMGLQFNLIINEKDLDGEPLPGRRFRGVIWLIGEIEFLTKYEEEKKTK